MIINHQMSINATETVKSKLSFEREAQSQGVVIKGYHTNKGIFNTLDFMEELLKKQQKIRFIGSGASHQNGSAERSIKTLVTMTSTILMNNSLRRPEETWYTDLWPMAMDYSVWF